MAALSWDEIVERGKQHNKTVICEVDQRGPRRKFKLRCNVCESEKESEISFFIGCRNCSNKYKKRRLTKEEFILKSKKIHENKYSYDLVEYINNETKVKILCNDCGNTFIQKPSSHLSNRGCPKK